MSYPLYLLSLYKSDNSRTVSEERTQSWHTSRSTVATQHNLANKLIVKCGGSDVSTRSVWTVHCAVRSE